MGIKFWFSEERHRLLLIDEASESALEDMVAILEVCNKSFDRIVSNKRNDEKDGTEEDNSVNMKDDEHKKTGKGYYVKESRSLSLSIIAQLLKTPTLNTPSCQSDASAGETATTFSSTSSSSSSSLTDRLLYAATLTIGTDDEHDGINILSGLVGGYAQRYERELHRSGSIDSTASNRVTPRKTKSIGSSGRGRDDTYINLESTRNDSDEFVASSQRSLDHPRSYSNSSIGSFSLLEQQQQQLQQQQQQPTIASRSISIAISAISELLRITPISSQWLRPERIRNSEAPHDEEAPEFHPLHSRYKIMEVQLAHEEKRINNLTAATSDLSSASAGLSPSNVVIGQVLVALMAFVPTTDQPSICLSILRNVRTLLASQPAVRQCLTMEDSSQLVSMIERTYNALEVSIKSSPQSSEHDQPVTGGSSGSNSNSGSSSGSNTKTYMDIHDFIEALLHIVLCLPLAQYSVQIPVATTTLDNECAPIVVPKSLDILNMMYKSSIPMITSTAARCTVLLMQLSPLSIVALEKCGVMSSFYHAFSHLTMHLAQLRLDLSNNIDIDLERAKNRHSNHINTKLDSGVNKNSTCMSKGDDGRVDNLNNDKHQQDSDTGKNGMEEALYSIPDDDSVISATTFGEEPFSMNMNEHDVKYLGENALVTHTSVIHTFFDLVGLHFTFTYIYLHIHTRIHIYV